ncbi:MAG: GIY-YIG nuclease family protein [Clostridiales bacterium]|nr:GIY-YIG nuclease family protein [Clostridiales bacterium]
MNYVYILECNDGTFYTGWTTDLGRRIEEHNSGKGSKYTRGRLPVKLVYYEVFDYKSDALRREYKIKKLSHLEKIKLKKYQKI